MRSNFFYRKSSQVKKIKTKHDRLMSKMRESIDHVLIFFIIIDVLFELNTTEDQEKAITEWKIKKGKGG